MQRVKNVSLHRAFTYKISLSELILVRLSKFESFLFLFNFSTKRQHTILCTNYYYLPTVVESRVDREIIQGKGGQYTRAPIGSRTRPT